MRLIDADHLYDKLCSEIDSSIGLCDLLDIIDGEETIEAKQVKHAKWIEIQGDLKKCSACDFLIYEQEKTDYCPCCGSTMDLGGMTY